LTPANRLKSATISSNRTVFASIVVKSTRLNLKRYLLIFDIGALRQTWFFQSLSISHRTSVVSDVCRWFQNHSVILDI